ncbi:MAG: hypothetical protein RL199_1827 [Pseudomonadota bacterium]|jgi:hypothetical protein
MPVRFATTDRTALAREARDGYPSRGGGAKAVAARAVFARAVWDAQGRRRLPTRPELDRALAGLKPADLEWLCEFAPLGPLYFLPTTRWVDALAASLRSWGVRRVLEVGAGEGLVSRALAKRAPDLFVQASDSGAWQRPAARMSPAERATIDVARVPGLALGEDVWKLGAAEAIRRFQPDLVMGVWLPPAGTLLTRLIRSPVRYVLDVGAAGGVTPGAWHWRFAHDLCEGPLEQHARCRLDRRPAEGLATRATLYFGRSHEGHHCERVRPGDWLWQFRPASGST